MVFFVVQSAFAQLKTISGVVTEKGSEVPLPEVSVFISQINKGSVTDFDGNYSIKAEDLKGKTIAFSYLGYKTLTVTLTGENQVINAELEADATSLEEVVVTALGIKREAKALGYSLTEVVEKIWLL